MEHPQEAEGRRPCLPLVGVRREHPEKGSPEGVVGGKTAFFFRKKSFFKVQKSNLIVVFV